MGSYVIIPQKCHNINEKAVNKGKLLGRGGGFVQRTLAWGAGGMPASHAREGLRPSAAPPLQKTKPPKVSGVPCYEKARLKAEPLHMPEGIDRLKAGRLVGGVGTENHAQSHAHRQRQHGILPGDGYRHAR